jgi:DNA polymerase (family 10)
VSKVDTRFPLSQAKAWALEAAEVVARYSPHVKVAGSIRRMRDDIGDVDLVVLDGVDDNPWQHGAIANALAELGYVQTKDGDKIASFTREGKASLDLYYATRATWGITLLVRTGSAAHNIKLAETGRRLIPTRKLAVSRGIVDTAGNVVASADELEIFAVLGLKYVEPEQREAPEYQGYIRQEVE